MPLLGKRLHVAALGAVLAVSYVVLTQASGTARSLAPTCFGVPATIVGTPGKDNVQGTPGNDVFAMGAGDDTVDGQGGDDLICGEGGDDVLTGGLGNDRLDGGTVNEGGGFNTYSGGQGNDQFVGTLGTDDLVIYDSAPAMSVDLGAGTAVGEGSDTLIAIESIRGSQFDDTLVGSAGGDWFYGADGNDVIRGLGGEDTLYGKGGNDTLDGGDEWDTFRGGAGDDVIIGGPGTGDLLSYVDTTRGVQVDLGSGRATGDGTDRLSSLEGVIGSTHDDTLTGDGLDNFFAGNDGNDTIRGGGGFDVAFFLAPVPVVVDLAKHTARIGSKEHDTLLGLEGVVGGPKGDLMLGGPGSDFMIGGAGNDVIRGKSGNDVLFGNFDLEPADADRLYGGPGNDIVGGDSGRNLLDGGPGSLDLASYWSAPVSIRADLGSRHVTAEGSDSLRGIEGIAGSEGNDTIRGDGRANLLSGEGGNDTLAGRGGADYLDGGDGSDSINGGGGRDYCVSAEKPTQCDLIDPAFRTTTTRSLRALRARFDAGGRLTAAPSARRAAGSAIEIDYGDRPSCTTSASTARATAGYAPSSLERKRVRHRTTAHVPQRVVAAAKKISPGSHGGHAAGGELTWRATLYKKTARGWVPFRRGPFLSGAKNAQTGELVQWTRGARAVRSVSFVVPAGNYAWKAVTTDSDAVDVNWIEPHVNYGSPGLFDRACIFKG